MAEPQELESKDSGPSKIRKKTQAVKRKRDLPKTKPPPLVFRAKLSEQKLRKIIRCYAERQTPKEAQRISGVSHVTAYRVYGQIRERLIHAGLYIPPDRWLESTKAAEEVGPYFDWNVFQHRLAEALGKHRGIRHANRPAYAAQEIFHIETDGRYSASLIYRLILLTIKSSGPLNRPPRELPRVFFHREFSRLMLSELRKNLRRSPESVRSTLSPKVDDLERKIDDLLADDEPLPPIFDDL